MFAHNNIIVKYRYYKGMFQARYRRDGKCIEVASTDFDTMKRKFIAKLCSEYDDAFTVQVPKSKKRTVTFAECAGEWLKLKERTTKPSTYKEYLRSYNVNLKPAFGHYKLTEITRAMVQEYLFTFVDFGVAEHTNPRTIATTLKRLSPHEVIMLWDGHSFDKDVKTSAVDRGYTTYSEEYILAEAEKVDYTF